MGSPASMSGMFSGTLELQMTMRQPAAVAMRPAVSLVAMPPVPHCVPAVLVSACRLARSCTWVGRDGQGWAGGWFFSREGGGLVVLEANAIPRDARAREPY
jgi:hypothetical protein